ncbi:MAG: inositol monophosphatase family protein, partial [Bdellovibrionales bacterium]
MKTTNLAAVQNIIEDVAATEIMPRFRKLEQGDIETKADNEIVTVADRAAEDALMKRLSDILPGSVIVAEEFFDHNPGILSRFDGENDVWVIDPIDGTWNFTQGRREFGVMVACVRRRETIAAWIHDPNTGHTLSAEKGGGVWLNGNKMRLAGSDPDYSRLMIVGSRLKSIVTKPQLAYVIAALPALAIGSAVAFDYARLFVGEVNFANSTAPRAT